MTNTAEKIITATIVPEDDRKEVTVTSPNGYHGKMSPQAASIVACLFAFNSECWSQPSDETDNTYYGLLDYSRSLPEADKISAAID